MDAESPTRPGPPLRKETFVEIFGYAGAAGAVAGTFATFSSRTNLSSTGSLVLMLVVTAVLVVAGAAIGGRAPDGYQRLRSVLWFVAIESFGLAAGVFWVTIVHLDGKTAALVVELSIAAAAFGLWMGLRRTLQQIAFFVPLIGMVAVLAAPSHLVGVSDLTTPFVVVWLSGVVWLVLGTLGIVRPARTACVTGAIVALIDTTYLLNVSFAVGLTLMAVTGIGLMVLGDGKGDRAVAGLGIVAVLIAAIEAVTRATSNSKGFAVPVLAIAICLAALAAAILVIRTATREGSPPSTELPPIPPPPTEPA